MGNGEYASKAKSLVNQGDRKLLSFGWFGNKYEDAAELFERGANQYKLAKMWKEAGDTYAKLADVNMKLDSKHDSASSWVEAAKAYQKADDKQKSRLPCCSSTHDAFILKNTFLLNFQDILLLQKLLHA
jgi:alpha-soluble NSF attachment protein